MKGARGEMAMLSTPAPGPTYVATEISVGSEVTPLETSTGAAPWNSGTAPAKATIETSTVSGDVTMGTRRLRSRICASGGKSTVVSASVSGGATERTTTNRTRSIDRPNAATVASDGKTGATATRAY